MRDFNIHITAATRGVSFDEGFVGVCMENLQGNIVVDFKDTFVDGVGNLEIKQGENKYTIVMEKQRQKYVLPILNSLLAVPGTLFMQFRVDQAEEEEHYPVFKSDIFYASVLEAINATATIPEEYPSWIQEANAKLEELEEATQATNALISTIETMLENGDFDGADGVGIQSITFKEATADGNVYTVHLTDGRTYEIVSPKGTPGQNGVGIQSISKTSTSGLVDTYTILLSNGSTTTFTVTNGAKGDPGATGNGIDRIEKTSSVGLVDTYTVYFTNGSTSTFTVTNGTVGADGNGISDISFSETTPEGNKYAVTMDDGQVYYIIAPKGDKGDTGATGETGNGIQSIVKTSTVGLVDTYTITYTNGTTTTFDVTNGDSEDTRLQIQSLWQALKGYVLDIADEQINMQGSDVLLPSSITVAGNVYPIADGARALLKSIEGNTINGGNELASSSFNGIDFEDSNMEKTGEINPFSSAIVLNGVNGIKDSVQISKNVNDSYYTAVKNTNSKKIDLSSLSWSHKGISSAIRANNYPYPGSNYPDHTNANRILYDSIYKRIYIFTRDILSAYIYDVQENTYSQWTGQNNFTGIHAVCQDLDYVYVGDANGQFYAYSKSTLAFSFKETNTPFYTGIAGGGQFDGITGICEYNGNLYILGKNANSSKPCICVYNLSSKTWTNTIMLPSSQTTWAIDVPALDVDNGKIYMAVHSAGVQKLISFDIATETFDSYITTPFTMDISAMDYDGYVLYCGDNNGDFAMYDTDAEDFLGGIIANFGSNPKTIKNDGNYLYVLISTTTNPGFFVIDKTTFSVSNYICNYWNDTDSTQRTSNPSIAVANDIVYIATGDWIVNYSKTERATINDISPNTSAFMALNYTANDIKIIYKDIFIDANGGTPIGDFVYELENQIVETLSSTLTYEDVSAVRNNNGYVSEKQSSDAPYVITLTVVYQKTNTQ